MSSDSSRDKILTKFNPYIIEHKRRNGHPSVIVFVAKRGCGKSTVIEDIVWHLGVKKAIVMSGTEEANSFYSSHIHPIYIYNNYDSEQLNRILMYQKAKAKECAKMGKKLNDFPDLGVLIIMDDLNFDTKVMKDPVMLEIFFNGRHYGITLLMAFQYMLGLPPAHRSNIDYVFVGRDVTREHMDKLYKYFFGIYNKAEEFRSAFKKYTQDYSFMVLDKSCKSDIVKDSVFWYRADYIGRKYIIGTREKWEENTKKLKEQLR